MAAGLSAATTHHPPRCYDAAGRLTGAPPPPLLRSVKLCLLILLFSCHLDINLINLDAPAALRAIVPSARHPPQV